MAIFSLIFMDGLGQASFYLGGLNCALFPSQENGAVEAVLGAVLEAAGNPAVCPAGKEIRYQRNP
jgi:hypothetical protein